MSLSAIAELVQRETGLDRLSMGPSALARAVRSRLTACGLETPEDYLPRLQGDAGEFRQLIEALVVPETWFFRDPEAFAALNTLATARAAAQGAWRLLSVPCSTGEEPYSMAMTLLEAGWPQARFRLEAADLSAVALQAAREGVYRRNAFRSQPGAWRQKYFEETARGSFSVRPRLRRAVHFRQANLLREEMLGTPGRFDVIFCRNVLIYFDAATQARVLHSLRGLLAPEGVLFVGAAEAFLTGAHGFVAAEFASAFRVRPPEPPAVALPPSPVRPVALLPAPRRLPAVAPLLSPTPAGPTLAEASRLADAGRVEEARRCCETFLQAHATSAEGHLLLGLLRDSAGDPPGAAACYRRALYLQPEHPEALRHLALHLEQQGDRPAAQRLLRRAVRSEEGAAR